MASPERAPQDLLLCRQPDSNCGGGLPASSREIPFEGIFGSPGILSWFDSKFSNQQVAALSPLNSEHCLGKTSSIPADFY
jgi:hypothetical protein